jgi:hypothetical protein
MAGRLAFSTGSKKKRNWREMSEDRSAAPPREKVIFLHAALFHPGLYLCNVERTAGNIAANER